MLLSYLLEIKVCNIHSIVLRLVISIEDKLKSALLATYENDTLTQASALSAKCVNLEDVVFFTFH